MSNVEANGIQIEYETFGEPKSPPLLLIIGFGSQLIFGMTSYASNSPNVATT